MEKRWYSPWKSTLIGLLIILTVKNISVEGFSKVHDYTGLVHSSCVIHVILSIMTMFGNFFILLVIWNCINKVNAKQNTRYREAIVSFSGEVM